MGRRPYCPSCMEVSYCTFAFGAIIRRDLRTLSLPCDSLRDNQYVCMIWVHTEKATHALTKLFGGLSYKKIRRYNNTPPYVTARWPTQQIPPLNFLASNTKFLPAVSFPNSCFVLFLFLFVCFVFFCSAMMC